MPVDPPCEGVCVCLGGKSTLYLPPTTQRTDETAVAYLLFILTCWIPQRNTHAAMSCLHKRPKRSEEEERAFQEHVKKVAQENGKRLGLEGDTDVQFLLLGGELVKVRSTSWKKMRFFKLQEDCKTIWHESHKKFKRNQTFSVDEIDSMRLGRQSEGLNKHTHPVDEAQCFSIIFKGRKKNLDLMAPNGEVARKWVNGIEKIMNNMRNLNHVQKSEHWIINCMRKADKNEDNKMTLKELKHFLRQINVEVDDVYAEEIFKKCDESNSGSLEGSEIEHFYNLLTQREEINVIYDKYAATEGQMSSKDLLNFLLNEQREQVNLHDAVRLIEKYEVDQTAKQRKHMTKDGFLMYLHQDEGCILNPAHKHIYQDMHQPLNHYFISSSHNTYLMEDQLKGPSSTEAYIKALMKSCRCVELDCWDGPNGEPIIYHGYTITSKVLFRDVIKAIKDYAFKTSQYPVILSLENHCTVDQQKLMAHHLISILGGALLTKPLGNSMPSNFPSPEALKGRFLIKGKRLNKLDDAFNNILIEDGTVSEEDEAADSENGQKGKSKKSKIKLAKELSDIVIYCKSVHFSGFEHARDSQAFYEMSSFKESKAFNLADSSATAYIHHNMDKLSRIYPAGSRTDSSNYNPVPMWNVGCQIVALNFQTPSKEMQINQGRFLPNGFCGYILKPEFMRNPSSQFDPNKLTHGPWLKRKTFHVMVISAQQLPKLNKDKPKSIVDPLVRVELYGVPADNASKETHYISNNGFNPMWNHRFQFDVHVPELAMVRFVVEDYDSTSQNDLIGQYCLPLTSIQNGYRHVPLLTKRGDIISSAGLFLNLMLIDVK
ncbi:1-phosphatidylinositol 4,5-bisphosphate phosphodiesterase delta-1a isoform X1 [Takifugu flavidus]|uniref:1-phosphatidylinositol 4,5-bisphosphate phosphodiesterase delta-1a isoform X1 n=1 Tax=Takifugu flavidus TaxID=433684 RepID=UPI00254490A1|nr:1-phosphatidylinositol 4,5-bisphosphate phosphodiesterase delta-1a isoform X1 [Takifugu flavidus]